MMFKTKVQVDVPLPKIEMQVVTNSEGIAVFNLDDYIVSPTKLYFEVFVQEGDDYVWESITHPEKIISKGTKWTTSIIVN